MKVGDVVELEPGVVDAKRIAANNLAAASEKFASDMPDWAGWFLVAVRSGYEQAVEAAMGVAGVKAWVPRCDEERVLKPDRRGGKRPRKKKKSIISVVSFPGYIAVWIVPSGHSWEAITGFENVIGLVVANPESWLSDNANIRLRHALTQKMIDRIKGLEVELHKKDSAYFTRYSLGEKVRVIEGPFHSFPAEVTFFDEELMVIGVEIEIFGRLTPVEMELDQIEKCS